MKFLDNQHSFDLTFGPNPVLRPYDANKSDEGDVRKKLLEYSNKCMFDTFLDICQQDYVGEIRGNAVTKLIHEVCKQITAIKIEKQHGQRCVDTPEEIYAKYISILSGLPHDADKWSITICSSYLSFLPLSLQGKWIKKVLQCLT